MRHTKRSEQVKAGAKLMPYYRIREAAAAAKERMSRPKRYTLAMRRALELAKLCYTENTIIWNEFHKVVYQGEACDGNLQTIDFLVRARGTSRGLIAILIHNRNSLNHANEKQSWEAKQSFLDHQNIPTLIIPSHYTSQEMQVKIVMLIRKLRNK